MLVNKNILLISPEPWDHIFVSKHHYAVHLAKRGNVVFFLNPPAKTNRIIETDYKNVYEVDYRGFPPGLRFFPSIIQKKIMLSVYRQIENLCAVKFDIVWSFDNSVFFNFDSLPPSVLKISHIVDISQDFQTRRAASTADLCLCASEVIKARLSSFSSKVYKINHGYNMPVFDGPVDGVDASRRTRAVYAGNLAIPYIDWNLLLEVIKANTEVDFVFIGPGSQEPHKDPIMNEAKRTVLKSSNAIFVGRLGTDQLLEYYRITDVFLVAYQEKYQRTQVTNTHKMMEYLGSGKVIVATSTLEYIDLIEDGMIAMSNCNAEFVGLFREVIDNLSGWNSLEKQSLRRAFALENCYPKQIQRIEKYLNNV